MNYERLIRRIRSDPRIFSTPEDHKIHRVLRQVKKHRLAEIEQERQLEPVGPYSGLTKRELRATGTCETDWY